MKKIFGVFVIVISVVFVCGCFAVVDDENVKVDTTQTVNQVDKTENAYYTGEPDDELYVNNEQNLPQENVLQICPSQTSLDVSALSKLGEYEAFITSDKTADTVTLYTSAQEAPDASGIMWDDSQMWYLVVTTKENQFVLYEQRLYGNAYFQIADFYNDDIPEKVISLFVIGNAYNEVREYRWREDCFVETIEYSTSDRASGAINPFYSTVPYYR